MSRIKISDILNEFIDREFEEEQRIRKEKMGLNACPYCDGQMGPDGPPHRFSCRYSKPGLRFPILEVE